ncbi:SanA/YdcF family protein [Mannheimia massilioguelmaensis]|uniref:SanA/YdcF family protein n=1 Tax=Mannheimia massilioguelmaensis TaxID=1604354 RepID=UPI0005C8F8FE|nr:ElyC/SanA/YdcF family protein [Mannheimia massilioguelmaensis]
MSGYKGIQSNIVSFLAPLKLLIKICSVLFAISILSLIAIDQGIAYYVRHDVYTDINKLPYRPYGLLLGTSKYFAKNTPNLFYVYRLEAAENLFKSGKVNHLLLSGDNRTLQYNEPRTMFKDLRQKGIEEEYLHMDFAGFRTLDSIIRAKEIFHATPMTIITQKFHCERALFIAKFNHIDAICYSAEYPKDYPMVRFREIFARALMLWEIFTEKEPHFLGTPEPLPSPTQNTP